MECNRDEAIRAKAIAEEKLGVRDFAAAKKFALKAQTLYPSLEGLPQMLTTIDVYISAENKVSGEVDWYGVLGVSPSADDETVRKQYRKLALMLHPDKNKCVAGDGAFKLLSEAWSLLSDKVKRLEYNQRRSARGFQPKVPAQGSSRTANPPSSNGFHSVNKNVSSNPKTKINTARANTTSAPPSHPPQRRSDTFWTICHRCKMHYEYLKIYLNHTLLCPNCHKAFLASETPPPFSFSKPTNMPSQNFGKNDMTAQNLGRSISGHSSVSRTNNHSSTFSGTSVAAKAAHIVQQVNQKLKRDRDEVHVASGWEEGNVSNPVPGDRPFKNRRMDDESLYYGGNKPHPTGMGNSNFEKGRTYGLYDGNSKPNSIRELTPFELRNMLVKKAQMEIRKKLKEWSSEAVSKKTNTKEKDKNSSKNRPNELSKAREPAKSGAHNSENSFTAPFDDGTVKENPEAMSMNVPDPDFHDFDGDRTEKSFGDNQVWAAYDDDDGMPRFYAMIHKVISTQPFKMKISWLNSKSNSEFGSLNWIGSGFFKTCGEFRIGRHEVNKSINSFSHRVCWTKGARGTIQIFPMKGDVWALYKNWSHEWNEHTPDEVIHKYEMVEVLEDYNEEHGVTVTPLIKVAGFRTVFHPHIDPNKVRRIPREEMFRFSHRVPRYFLTGREAANAPKGCLELDPAATPLELLQVITEAHEATAHENGGKVEEKVPESGTEIRKDEVIDLTVKDKLQEMVGSVQRAQGDAKDTAE